MTGGDAFGLNENAPLGRTLRAFQLKGFSNGIVLIGYMSSSNADTLALFSDDTNSILNANGMTITNLGTQ